MESVQNCLACNSTNHPAYLQTRAMMHHQLSEKFNFDRCAECGLVFLNPRVPEGELKQFYTSAYLPYRLEEAWGRYSAFVKRDQRKIDHKRVKIVKQSCRLATVSRILDIGCGKPTFLAELCNHTTAQLIGLDFSDEGWGGDSEGHRRIKLRKGQIPDLVGERPVDVITMWHYLEHDYNPQHHLRKLLNVAHSDTRLIVEVPNFDSYTRRKFGEHWAGYHTPRHTALYTPSNIEILFNNAGWRVDTLALHGSLNPYNLHWMSRMEQQEIDWSTAMEPRFIGYVASMVLHLPIYLLQRRFSMGLMTVTGRPH